MALKLTLNGEPRDLEVVGRKPSMMLMIDGRAYSVTDRDYSEGLRRIEIDGTLLEFVEVRDGNVVHVKLGGRIWTVDLVDPRDAVESLTGDSGEIRAPMPGVVVSIARGEGEYVQRGEPVLTIESMKLQMTLVAPRDGMIASLLKQANQTFDKDEVLVIFAKEPTLSQSVED